MVRLAALLALGISAAIAVPLEPSFAPLPEVSPDAGVELIPAASLEPLGLHTHTTGGHSHALGVTPEPFAPHSLGDSFAMATAEPFGSGELTATAEPEAVPFMGATAEPAPDTPFVSAEPDAEPGVSPEPTTPGVNDNVTDAFVVNPQGSAEPLAEAPPLASIGENSGATNGTKPMNEGCVAIEHLEGYVLQHKQHLTRDVLCADGFCATPNHAIIVDGAYTSMKQLCNAGWKCTESVKLVNNLKVWANRRAVVNDRITVTPYDVRFPKAASWVAQAAEEVYDFVSSSIVMATVVALVLFVFGARNNKSKLQ